MSKISVIVPVYKVEKYLGRCVESIINQTYRDLEIVLVDDGSPDRCGEICEEYAKKDPRIKVLHTENGGLSCARNAGLAAATGDYVGFIDSDDYIHPQMYEKLYTALIDNQADISICNYAYVDELTDAVDPEMTALSPITTEVLSRKQAYQRINPMMAGYSFYVTAWNKLYKRSLFNNIKFKDGHIHEDEYIVHHLFRLCERITTIDDILYMYIQRKGSITKVNATLRSLDAVYALYDRYLFFLNADEKTLATDVLRSASWALIDLLPKLNREKNTQQVNNAVLTVLRAMIRKADLRAIRLIMSWIGYLTRSVFATKPDQQ